MNENTTDPDQKKILQLYAAFGAALVLSVVPSVIAAFACLFFFLGVLIAAYIICTSAEEGSLAENHMTFVIRTIWIGSFLGLLSIIAGSIYLFYNVDNTTLDPCIQNFLAIGSGMQNMEIQALVGIFEPCLDNYLKINMRDLIIGGIISAGPILIYFIVRFTRGLSRALNSYRIANVRSWF